MCIYKYCNIVMRCEKLFFFVLYVIAIYLFGLFIKLLDYSDLIYQHSRSKHSNNSEFDYIIVGCGSAGSVVARRLAEDKHVRILVLEAGSHGNPLLDIPPLALLLQKTHFSWQYTTEPQNNACLALKGNVSFWPYGKIVGGTGMLNNRIYVRGHPEDFDEWFKDKEKYSYTKYVEPYFKKLETFRQKGFSIATKPVFSSILPDYLLQAAKMLGLAVLNSTLNCNQGFGEPKINQQNGRRLTTSHYIANGEYPNILLHTKSEVREILFHDNFEAYGVKYKHLNGFYTATSKKGVILSAGVIGTPKILLRSGIGPKCHLTEFNISTISDLPVGENLQDHITTGFDLIQINQSLGLGIKQLLSPYSAFRYFLYGDGPWTSSGCETLGFLNTKNSTTLKPDIQYMAMPVGVNDDDGIFIRHLFGIRDQIWDKYFALFKENVSITILPVLLHPKSRGTIRLKNTNPETEISINPQYLSHEDDVDTLIRGIEFIKKIAETKIMQKLGAKLNTHVFPGCEDFEFDTKPYWKCYIRHLTMTSYHGAGTCKMGHPEDRTSVVDFDFQVKGTNNLYVVDGSILPSLTSGNINGAILMLAEMASDILKDRNYLGYEKCHVKEIFLTKNI